MIPERSRRGKGPHKGLRRCYAPRNHRFGRDLAKDASAIRRKRLLDMNLGTVPKNWDRRTSIVATLGPATSTPQKIRDLIASGVDVMRLNFAHGEASEHAQRYEAVRAGEREVGRTVAVLQDLAGHKIRVGRLRDGALELREGQSLIITADEVDGGGPAIPIIAKLEKAEAINALDEIIKEADGVMVARGDLGVELDAEWVPVLQNTIIQKANAAGIPVIIATQMLESMVHSPRPTRAETSDVANAILDGADAVMLSAETAVGEYPIEAVKMMDRIARVIESSTPTIFGARGPAQEGTTISLAHAAATVAHDISARAIVVMTRSGLTAQLLSKLRPHAPLIAFTEQETTARRLALWWGVQCFATTFEDNTDAMIAHLEDELLRRRLAEIGDTVIIVGSAPLVVRGRVNFVKMHRVRHTDA